MGTIPVDDPACLDEPEVGAIELLIAGRSRDVGTISVARLLPAVRRRTIGPFIFLDHMGPVMIEPGVGFDVPPHPHIGLSTVTYFFAGENVHRDSLGTVQVNRPGDVNLMTAGRGVVHSERAGPAFRAAGGLMHGVQMWLALPLEHEDDEPSFEHHPGASLPVIAPAAGAYGRVLIGSGFGATSPIQHPSQPWLVDIHLGPGTELGLEPGVAERGILVIEGAVHIGDAPLAVNQLVVLSRDACPRLRADTAARLLLVGGPPVGPRLIEWNFVASTQDRIDRASADWKARRFPTIPTDDREFVPQPGPTPRRPVG